MPPILRTIRFSPSIAISFADAPSSPEKKKNFFFYKRRREKKKFSITEHGVVPVELCRIFFPPPRDYRSSAQHPHQREREKILPKKRLACQQPSQEGSRVQQGSLLIRPSGARPAHVDNKTADTGRRRRRPQRGLERWRRWCEKKNSSARRPLIESDEQTA